MPRLVSFEEEIVVTDMKSRNVTRSVLGVAVGSRAVVLCLFVLWRGIASSYDTSAELGSACLSSTSSESSESVLQDVGANSWGRSLGAAIERSIVWDGVYYMRIAECGYEYEQSFAFLPGLPMLMRVLSRTVLSELVPVIGRRATLALSGYLINNVAFIGAAYYLLRLSTVLLGSEKQAMYATVLFCCNPASAFFSGLYSESLFALFSFSGTWFLVRGAQWPAVILFGLTSGVRSNGVLHAGFFLFQAMHDVCNKEFMKRPPLITVSMIVMAVLRSAAVIAPFVAFQGYGFLLLCVGHRQDQSCTRPWCEATIPYLYGFVQSEYWDVGFFRYFQMKQLPNFLLASPMLGLAVCSIITYAKNQPVLFFSLGLSSSPVQLPKVDFLVPLNRKSTMFRRNIDRDEKVVKGKSSTLRAEARGSRGKNTESTSEGSLAAATDSSKKGYFAPSILCFIIELGFMVCVAVFVMHVQVATRFLSVHPAVYWYGSHLLTASTNRTLEKIIWTVFLGYVSVGSLLFINFYPFT